MFSQIVAEVLLTSVPYNIKPPIRIVCNLVDSIRKTNDLIYSEAMTNDTINEGIVETSTIRNHLQTKNCVKKAEEEEEKGRETDNDADHRAPLLWLSLAHLEEENRS